MIFRYGLSALFCAPRPSAISLTRSVPIEAKRSADPVQQVSAPLRDVLPMEKVPTGVTEAEQGKGIPFVVDGAAVTNR